VSLTAREHAIWWFAQIIGARNYNKSLPIWRIGWSHRSDGPDPSPDLSSTRSSTCCTEIGGRFSYAAWREKGAIFMVGAKAKSVT